MMNYMVSSHGGRYTNTAKITLPANVTVKFFVQDGDLLDNDKSRYLNAWGLYNRFVQGLDRNGNQQYFDARVAETVTPGGKVYNYDCWDMTDNGHKNVSGIFSPGTCIDPLDNQLSLQQVIDLILAQTNTPVTIYWVACREVTYP